jgi:adenylate cyclase
MSQTRRLAAILAADVAGYSRLIGADEGGTLERLRALRRELLDPKFAEHRGRLVKTTGDGLLVEFGSVVDALRCAVDVQRETTERNANVPPDSRIEFRIGINVGDIVVEDGDIFGDGVNVAARLEGLAEPGGICVAARVQEDAAGKLDLAFEDIGEQQLKNIARPVRVYRVVRETRPAMQMAVPGPPLPDKPSIAVLPFANMSGDSEQEYFADGMAGEIITALSRIRWLFVIARNSSFTYKGRAIDVKQVGRELGVRYVLEGSVRKAGGRVRIAAQLIEAETGADLWADRFDGSLEAIFDLQDQVATSVAGVIEPTLQAAEIGRSIRRPTVDLTAYDLYLRALALQYSPRDEFARGFDLLGQAVERDPQYGSALALTAYWYYRMDLHRWSQDVQTTRRNGLDFARRALRHDPENPEVLSRAAFVLGYFGEDVHTANALADRLVIGSRTFHVRSRPTMADLDLRSGEAPLPFRPGVGAHERAATGRRDRRTGLTRCRCPSQPATRWIEL